MRELFAEHRIEAVVLSIDTAELLRYLEPEKVITTGFEPDFPGDLLVLYELVITRLEGSLDEGTDALAECGVIRLATLTFLAHFLTM